MGIFSKILAGVKIAGSVASAFNPVFAMLPVLIQGVESAVKQGKQGAMKKEIVRSILVSYFAIHEGIAEKDLYSDDAFIKGVDKIIDGLVEVYNAVLWKQKKAAENV